MQLSKNALQLLESRYLRRNRTGKLMETPDAMFKRVARHIASREARHKDKWAEHFYDAMSQLLFLPNSPTLMHAGLPHGQLSACFVLPVEDNLKSIFTTMAHMAMIHQQGGGTGFNFSGLRPMGEIVSSSGRQASGPLAFMELYDTATEKVRQGARRSGANMAVLNVDHPDIEAFVKAKSKGTILRNFNLSVGVSDAFMTAMENNSKWELLDPRTAKRVKSISARRLWDQIVGQAWSNGDPGLLFLDAINRDNPLPKMERIQCTNPCGEVPLADYGSCNLGSLNLAKMVRDENGKRQVDWDLLEHTIAIAMRFLDNVLSVNTYVIPEIAERTMADRKVGLGVMGWAELLILLEIPYASDQAVELGERLMEFIGSKSKETSQSLAKERGVFPNWESSLYYPDRPMRNATCNSIAPTGSISIIADTSYSIEPLYALAYQRVGVLNGRVQNEINSMVVSHLRRSGLWSRSLQALVRDTGSIQEAAGLPNELRNLLLTSMEIPWRYHLRHQQAFQKYTDNAVAKTVNLSSTASKETVSEIYSTAWHYGLKGITVYRDGSRADQTLQACRLNKLSGC